GAPGATIGLLPSVLSYARLIFSQLFEQGSFVFGFLAESRIIHLIDVVFAFSIAFTIFWVAVDFIIGILNGSLPWFVTHFELQRLETFGAAVREPAPHSGQG